MSRQGSYFTFLETFEDNSPIEVWHHEGDLAVNISVTNPEGGGHTHVRLGPGESLNDALARTFTARFKMTPDTLAMMELRPGQYYPRMARPLNERPDRSPGSNPDSERYADELATMRGQLISLMHTLIDICQVVHPEEHTWNAYGHEIRNLLILASTEVEAHWRAVLLANGYRRDRFSTNDYVKLQQAMRLGEFGFTLPYYPWLPVIRPFATWGAKNRPTQDLVWYDAYNAVKHDRQVNFAPGDAGKRYQLGRSVCGDDDGAVWRARGISLAHRVWILLLPDRAPELG